MKNRIISSIIIAAILVAFIPLTRLSVYFADVLIVAIMFFAAYEVNNAVREKFGVPYLAVILAGIPVMYLLFYFGEMTFFGGVGTAFIGVFLLFFGFLIVNAIRKQSNQRAFATVFVLIYPLCLLIFLLALSHNGYGLAPLVLCFVISCLSDVFALLVGVTVKGPKLAPKISPKKTISGAIGGLVGGIAGAYIIYMVIYVRIFEFIGITPFADGAGIAAIHCLILGLFGSVFTQTGDLFASYLKRKMEIKDFGHLIPGHGGVMDRLDGIIFNAVFVFIYFSCISLATL